ncbi:DNA recombination protein RmuC [Leifsonia sp. H3M29-4]|uniref:DNA recombination protein RmuC n=1 Tax=Salinibacterium metalliresistens TaxID=3031321 RepID=UPI0023DB757F|nr:DNA recombination protein RmuC [Salinibacterium metalliresistens]MDF1479483.1 DNA recombination protein RmuC [Salinibacterium metalliresistens]
MDPILALVLGFVVGIVLGGVGALLFARGRRTGIDPAVLEARHQNALVELRMQEQAVQSQLIAERAAIQATADGLREQLVALERAQREQAERERAESKVLQALSPVQETLRTMQQKVADLERQRSQQYGAIAEQLKQTQLSGEQIRVTTESLASALRSNATRGVWGETQLRNVVQAAGLIERVDFDVQSSITSDAGAGRPDMVIHLPGGKNIAVDAKVPFAAYLEATQIPVTATGEEGARRESLIKQHVKVLRSHIDALASKTYWAGLEASPELVIAFIPSESLVSSALEADPAIMDYAFGKRVALASPVTLWSVLKTVAFSWQQDVLTDEAKTLFDLSKELYGRLATLADHADRLRRSIDSTVASYNQFANSLETRVLVTARKLNMLDESKVIGTAATIEQAPKQLTAVEMELAALDELEGVGRPELDIPELPAAKKPKTA